nr:S41 family peptidase [uncultured Actinoplanes sp.]
MPAQNTHVPLPEFLATTEVGGLTPQERLLIVRQALLILEQSYTFLTFKSARYGINPLQRLRLLQQRLERPGQRDLEWQTHAELLDIFNSLRDLHTRYVLPTPYRDATASLPFLLKEYREDGRPRYLVTRLVSDQPVQDENFRNGVEVTHWNGVAVARAVERFAERMPGANPAARHSRAVQFFTFRSLGFAGPPDEDWITVSYLGLDGVPRDVRVVWQVSPLAAATRSPDHEHVSRTEMGIDVEGDHLARRRTEVFAPEVVRAEASGVPLAGDPAGIPVTAGLSTVYEARSVPVAGRTIGHLRIRTFKPPENPPGVPIASVDDMVAEFVRLLGLLPPDGLVLDIRGNGGGAIVASEMCLQALTARPLAPEPAQFAATALNLRLCRGNDDLSGWLPSMEQALESGASHSAGLTFTTGGLLRRVPQSYFGPIVLITDARVYSAADMFAAGFQDNGLGTVLGVDDTTGAGGANVWDMRLLVRHAPGGPFSLLPGGADMTVAIRRVLRVGRNEGSPVEDYGVAADEKHDVTRRDILEKDADLMAAAARILDKGRPRRFDITVTEAGGELTVGFGTVGVDRADVLLDGRPRLTVDLDGNPGPALVPGGPPAAAEVLVLGYDRDRLVAARRFRREGGELRPHVGLEPE